MSILKIISITLVLLLTGCAKGDEAVIEVNNPNAEVEVVEGKDGVDIQTEVWKEKDAESGKDLGVKSVKRIKDGKVVSETIVREYINGESEEVEEVEEVEVEE